MFLDIDGHCQHVALYGSENHPALVLLHSLGTCHAVWERQIRAFSKSHFVICPDFRGHGLSEVSRTPVTVEALAEDVVAILAAIGVNRFDLAGISIGGLVAQRVAATLREEVRTLTLLDSNIVSLAPKCGKIALPRFEPRDLPPSRRRFSHAGPRRRAGAARRDEASPCCSLEPHPKAMPPVVTHWRWPIVVPAPQASSCRSPSRSETLTRRRRRKLHEPWPTPLSVRVLRSSRVLRISPFLSGQMQ